MREKNKSKEIEECYNYHKKLLKKSQITTKFFNLQNLYKSTSKGHNVRCRSWIKREYVTREIKHCNTTTLNTKVEKTSNTKELQACEACKLYTRASIHKLTHSFTLATQPSLLSQSLKQLNCLLLQIPKHHCPMTIRALGFSKCLESCDHKFETYDELQIWTIHHRWMVVEGKQHNFA